jgi:hypothetical protein
MTIYLPTKLQKNVCDTDCSVPHIKTNSKLILKTYDKNLLQSNGHSRNCEIPIDGYFGNIASSDIGINPVFSYFCCVAPQINPVRSNDK